jgi:hypothetical protein
LVDIIMMVIAPAAYVGCLAFAPIWVHDLDHAAAIVIGLAVLDFVVRPTLRSR